jgi:predicted component of type VI protein secretion system
VAAGPRERIAGVGIEALERATSEFIARRFLESARFDPLHDGATEQRLYDQLPEWLARLTRQGEAELSLEHQGNLFRATVSATALREFVGAACEPLTRRLRAVLSPREPALLQVHHVAAAVPGVIESLARLPNCIVVVLEPAAAARGAARLPTQDPGAGNFRLASVLPWDQPPVTAEDLPGITAGPAGDAAQAPTHVLFEGRAWRLGAEPLQVGTELATHEYGIRLDSRAQGVSRRHCALQLEDGRAMVHDQSRYGTLLNGHRIESSAVLQAGDVLGIGRPPRELALVAEVPRAP